MYLHHPAPQFEHKGGLIRREVQRNDVMRIDAALGRDPHREKLQQTIERQTGQNIFRRKACAAAIGQLLVLAFEFMRSGQHPVAPVDVVRRKPHHAQRRRLELFGGGVLCIDAHQIARQFCCPARVAAIERSLRFRLYPRRAAHQRHQPPRALGTRQRVERGGVAIKPAQLPREHLPHRMLDGAVILAQPRVCGQMGWQRRQSLGQFVRRVALVDKAHRLIVREGDGVAIGGEQFGNVGVAGHRAAMRGHHEVNRASAAARWRGVLQHRASVRVSSACGYARRTALHQFPHHVNRAYPLHRVAIARAANRMHVGKALALNHLGREQHLEIGQARDDFVVGFRWGVDEFKAHAGQRHIPAILEGMRGREKGRFAACEDRPDACVDIALGCHRQQGTKTVGAAGRENRADQRGVVDHHLHQRCVRDDPGLARLDASLIGKRAHAADVIGVIVGVDHRAHRQRIGMRRGFAKIGPRRFPSFLRLGGVDDDQCIVAHHEDHVSQCVADGAIDALRHAVDALGHAA